MPKIFGIFETTAAAIPLSQFMRLIIAGTRHFVNYRLLCHAVDLFVDKFVDKDITIISGGARGADSLGEKYASERGLSLERYPADWEKYGRGAGHIRNEQMAKTATHCICFWDGASPGTRDMIALSEHYGLILKVIKYA